LLPIVNGVLTLAFNRVGSYETRVTVGKLTADEAPEQLSDLALAEPADAMLDEIQSINAISVDLAMSLDDIESLFV